MKKLKGPARSQLDSSQRVQGFGDRIATAAARIGTRKMAANAAGVSVDSLQRYLREERYPPIDVVAALAAAAGVCVRWLVTGDGDQSGAVSFDIDQSAAGSSLALPILNDYEAVTGFLDGALPASHKTHLSARQDDQDSFAMIMDTAAMSPLIRSGSVIIVDKKMPAQQRECVAVVAFPEWQEVVVRKWIVDMGQTRLEPIATGYRSLDVSQHPYRFVGRVVRVEIGLA